MWEGHGIDIGQGGIRTAVFGMAVPAGQSRRFPDQLGVQGGWGKQLCRDIVVTNEASTGHVRTAQKGGVAAIALVGKFCMGTHAAQGCTWLGIQSTRVEQHAALCNSKTRDDQPGQ